MRKFLVASFLLGLAACGGASGLEKEMQGWKDKICKCTDKTCAEKTWTEYREWTKTKRDEAKSLAKDKLEKLEAIENEAKACRKKFRDEPGGEGAAPTGDKPADKPADGAAPAAPPADKPADK
ncbi:MAG TPA: hypothetical protein VNO30_46455 [Kofleriaceae bacterium]|nr:hypothetical protein [Kofleriaceae bacterium]